MSTLFAGPVDSPYRRSITPSKAGIGVDSRSLFEVVMDSVARLLADPRARLSSPRTINVLSDLIARAERTVNTADPRSSLVDVWWALLVVAETSDHNQSLAVRRQLVVALAKMLCSPVEMPRGQRQCYWEMLKGYLLVLERTPGYEDTLARIDLCFPYGWTSSTQPCGTEESSRLPLLRRMRAASGASAEPEEWTGDDACRLVPPAPHLSPFLQGAPKRGG